MGDLTEGYIINNPTSSLVSASNKATQNGKFPAQSLVGPKSGFEPFLVDLTTQGNLLNEDNPF